MPLVHMGDMLAHAYRHRYAVGAFDLVGLAFLEAILEAAESRRAPVILSVAESHFELFDVELALAACVCAARRARVPVAIHLDHGHSLESARRAIAMGCNGVMVDASHLPFEDNVARTRAVVALAQRCGVPVEGELGYVPGVEGVDAAKHPEPLRYTAPEEAERYVAATGVDFLAVSIGTVHGRLRGEPRIDFARLEAIDRRLARPLVIHGGTGLPAEQYRALTRHGVAKINYFTALADAAAARLAENVAGQARPSWIEATAGVREAIRREVERAIDLFGSAGRADSVLAECRPWREVEHVIEFNTDLPEEEALALMREGRQVLARVAGVRRVFVGRRVEGADRYRYCWLIRFAGAGVIASYREDPDHKRFADERFRPAAADRITIDFEEI